MINPLARRRTRRDFEQQCQAFKEILAASLNVEVFLGEIEKRGYRPAASPSSGERWQNGDVFVHFSAREPDPNLARLGRRSDLAELWDAWAGFGTTWVTLVERGIRRDVTPRSGRRGRDQTSPVRPRLTLAARRR